MHAQFRLRQLSAFGRVVSQQLAANQGILLVADKTAAPHRAGNIAFGLQLGISQFNRIARNHQPRSQYAAGRQFCQIVQLPRRHQLLDGQMQRGFARHALT
ncbi:hypothetical protein D3C71_1442460 [compost metagenome]